jgi:hypothetical protein
LLVMFIHFQFANMFRAATRFVGAVEESADMNRTNRSEPDSLLTRLRTRIPIVALLAAV